MKKSDTPAILPALVAHQRRRKPRPGTTAPPEIGPTRGPSAVEIVDPAQSYAVLEGVCEAGTGETGELRHAEADQQRGPAQSQEAT
jgi:hypothetical protein